MPIDSDKIAAAVANLARALCLLETAPSTTPPDLSRLSVVRLVSACAAAGSPEPFLTFGFGSALTATRRDQSPIEAMNA
jgi:hypothetical protein